MGTKSKIHGESANRPTSYPLWLFCILLAIADIVIYSFLVAYYSSYLLVPHNRWVSVYRDFHACFITDYSKAVEKTLTYKLEWGIRTMITLAAVHLLVDHTLIVSTMLEIKHWLLPYLIWNLMMILIVTILIITYFLHSSIDVFESTEAYLDFNKYWMWGLSCLIVYEIAAEVLVWSYFNQVHFRPKAVMPPNVQAMRPILESISDDDSANLDSRIMP